MPFKKGQSGNPGGRPRVLGEIQELARSYCSDAIEGLRSIAIDKKAPYAARVSAYTAILDRGIGKPLATVASFGVNKATKDMTDDELMALVMQVAGTENNKEQ